MEDQEFLHNFLHIGGDVSKMLQLNSPICGGNRAIQARVEPSSAFAPDL